MRQVLKHLYLIAEAFLIPWVLLGMAITKARILIVRSRD